MSLSKYRGKRDLRASGEPAGGMTTRADLRFVVQKHAASRLHYDFRLELDGVLKSWAVPKGPSLDPSDRRLAIQVEDHPLDYRTFEGVIPKGNYGAGEVIVWDEGTYTDDPPSPSRARMVRNLREQLRRGDMKIRLSGSKLHGSFALVAIRQGDGRQWLLIKHRDPDAARGHAVLRDTHSVLSGRTLRDLRTRAS